MKNRLNDPRLFFSNSEKEAITEAVMTAERQTSGEIRVHLEKKSPKDPFDRAREVFENIGMANTEAKNGVLIYLCLTSKRFAIIGDEGINSKIPPDFWDTTALLMQNHFKQDRFAEGIITAVQDVGNKLKIHFPIQPQDRNELSDFLSYS